MFVDPYRWLAEGLYQKKRKEEKKTMSKEAQNISMQQKPKQHLQNVPPVVV